ncbi:Uncharacterised protein [Mycobacteroides abscessus]|nr:Uncharacterised protein [Mycobacteroides abscessus]CPS17633.1 Uncharacterised protein [Mycobacteroides abscessus]CPS22778.1 Uncharacterised protein [Mycobacteroides abscessus]CPS90660.1 Uncharacterised protein [Mycobacteroides abscessus]CPT45609.1 Uncharacterised protein [Mycobacteroides abscessus]
MLFLRLLGLLGLCGGLARLLSLRGGLARLLLLRLLLGLLALLRGLLLRRLIIGVRLAGALGVSGVGLVVRDLCAVRGLLCLLRLLSALLSRNLLCTR